MGEFSEGVFYRFVVPSLSVSGRMLRWIAGLSFAIGLLVALPAAVSADPGDIGFQGPAGAGGAPSGSKPESKLWFNDGSWWGSLWDTGTNDFYIWKLNQATETWTRTNTRLDDRSSTRADVLWDGTKLYVASHNFSENDGPGTARFYRFSYDTNTDTYSLDGGFPATINSVKSETLVIAKDSAGKLWATWEAGGHIWVNRTTGSDSSWGTPFQLPGAAAVNTDDISSIIAFGGNKVGIFWSNQNASPDADYFAIHQDGTDDTTGWAIETAYTGTNLADDHVNLKTTSDGKVYSVLKTSLDNAGSSPLIVLLDRDTNGTWSSHTVSVSSFDQTRPILEIDETNGLLRVFDTSGGSGGTINQHTSPIGSISFPGGAGTVVIKDASALKMNNASSTKQNVTSATGLIVLAFDDTTKRYWHADILGGGPPPNTAPTANATSATTPSGQAVSVALSGTDPETCQLTFSIVTPPGHGTLGSIADSACTPGNPNADSASVTYTPNGGFSGADTFTYKVNDGTTDSTPATASLTVTGTDTTPPSRTTTTVNGASLVINYDEPLDTGSVPAASAYAPLVSGSARGVSNVGVAGSAVTLTLASPVISTDTVTLSYTPPGTNPVQDPAGNDAASFSGIGVTNNTPPSGGGTSTFVPTDDAQVKSTSPTANYGSLATMQLREEAAPGVTYHDYLKFNVTGLGGTVSAVKLRLFVTDVSPDSGTVYGVVDTSWSESSIIWNNAPLIGSTALGSAGATTTVATWVEINLSPSAVSGNGLVSFALKTTSTNSSIFSSSEGTNPPELVVTTSGGGDITPPNRTSTAVNGASLVIGYNEALDTGSVPANGDFAPLVNGSARAVNNVAVSGSSVTLTLASPVISTDTVTLSYTAGSNPVQDVAGNNAADYSGAAVTNNTPPSDTTAPVLQSAAINGSALTLTYNETLNGNSDPSPSDLTITVNGSARSLSNIDASGTTVTATAASPVISTDTVLVNYTPGSSPIEDVAGNDAASLTNQAVTNNTPPSDVTPPSRTSTAVNGASLVIGYNEALDTGSVPANGDFAPLVNGSARAVNNVVVSGSSVTLTLASPVISTDTVTLSYTAGSNPVQDVAGNNAADYSGAAVTNNTPPSGGGTFTFVPTDDAQVKSTSPTSNYGSLATMQLREEPPGGTLPTYRDYLKFNVTGMTGSVSTVKLRLWITDVSTDSGSVFGVADTTWTEGTIVWNTAPALGSTALGSAGATTTVGAWVEITLSPSAVSGNGVVSFGLKTTSTNSSIFDSSEGGHPPELVVTTT